MTYPARDVRVRPSTGLSAYSTMLRLYVNDASERILPSPSCLSICSFTSFSIYPLTCFLERWPEKSSTKSPNKKVKSYYNLIGETIPASLKIKDFRRKVMLS